VQREHRIAAFVECRGDVLGIAPRVAEDHRRHRLVLGQQPGDGIELALGFHLVKALHDLGHLRVAVDADLHRIALELVAQRADLVGERGREQVGLALARRVLDHATHVVGEAHVEHAVGLVEHEHAQRREFNTSFFQMFQNSPGRADDDLRHVHQRFDLHA
jgi:hypothetical protein